MIWKNFNYFKTKLYLAFISGKEYKINVLSLLISDIGYILILFLFFDIFSNLNSSFFYWTKIDKFFYIVLLYSGIRFMRYFQLWRFNRILTKGDLNIYLTKPISTYLQSSSLAITGPVFYTSIPIFLILLYFLFFVDYGYKYLGFLFHIFGISYLVLVLNFLQSLNFFFKDNFLYNFFFNYLIPVNEKFTSTSFSENSILGKIFSLLPTSIYSYFSLEILKGNFYIFDYLFFILFSYFFFLFSLIFLWKFGLKKYEAFG